MATGSRRGSPAGYAVAARAGRPQRGRPGRADVRGARPQRAVARRSVVDRDVLRRGRVQRMWSGHVDDGVKAYESAISRRSPTPAPTRRSPRCSATTPASACSTSSGSSPTMHAAERANRDRRPPSRTRATTGSIRSGQPRRGLISANRNNEALALLDTARANNVRRFEQHQHNRRQRGTEPRDNLPTRAVTTTRRSRSSCSTLAIDQKLGEDHVDVPACTSTFAAYRCSMTTAPRSPPREAAQIFRHPRASPPNRHPRGAHDGRLGSEQP